MGMRNIYKAVRKRISPYYRYLEMRLKIVWYNMHRGRIIRSIREKEKIRVAFFVVNLSMWKTESLFRLMLGDSRFEVFMVPMPRPMLNQDAEKLEQMRLIEYCRQNAFPYIPGYDYNTGRFNSWNEIKPDIVFYSQPYNAAFPAHKLERFWKHCLFYYIPYCFIIEKNDGFTNTLYMNICQSVFVENDILKHFLNGKMTNRGRNLITSGFVGADKFRIHEDQDWLLWKQSDQNLKRVIWAPHHSIRDVDILNYSVFLEIADDMLALARKYQGKIQFAFKPHPGLKPKLYEQDGWGRERTDRYYNEWDNMPNSILAEGSYYSLFRSSDAMIHDCSSFTVEYLYTGKPVFYITKDDHLDFMNELGALCFDAHYKGRTIRDITNFLEQVVLNGQDTMKEERLAFVSENLYNPEAKPAAEIILDSVKNLLSE